MASFKSKKFFTPQFMPGDGRAVVNNDVAAVTSAAVLNDTVEFPWPAGLELNELKFNFDDLDTGGAPAVAFKAGYAPIQADTQYSANLSYFAGASAITTGRTGGRYDCAFKPLKFEEDMKIVLTFDATAQTPAAGDIFAILVGAARGVR